MVTISKIRNCILAIKCEITLNEICTRYEVSSSQVHAWKKQLLEQRTQLFSKNEKSATESANKIKREQSKLYEKIGQLTVESDFFKKVLSQIPREQRLVEIVQN